MQIQSVSNYNSYQNPNFQKLIIKPVNYDFDLRKPERLLGLEKTIRENKSIQEYADALEEHAAIFGQPAIDVIVEYGESLVNGLRCIMKMSDTMYPTLLAAESGFYTDKSTYAQMAEVDFSHLTSVVKNKIQKGLMQNYLA